jgi:hypothetical protein
MSKYTEEQLRKLASKIKEAWTPDKNKTMNLVEQLRKMNPYPIDIFPEPSHEDWHDLGKFLQEHGKNPDRIFAKWGRVVWNNCCDQLDKLI